MSPIEWYPYEVRAWYPHMARLDAEIWSRFVASNPDAFDSVAYDLPVGEGAAFDTVVNPTTGGNIAKLYQRKIDVVGKKNDKYSVIEVGPRAGTAKIGQVKAYAKLFARDFPGAGAPSAVIITDSLLPEMDFLLKDEPVIILIA